MGFWSRAEGRYYRKHENGQKAIVQVKCSNSPPGGGRDQLGEVLCFHCHAWPG